MNNDRIYKPEDFLSYIRKPLSQSSLNILYSANDIKFERCQLYIDFTESLISKIIDTYMGDKYTDKGQRIEHFKWCWESNIKDFSSENINFYHSEDLFIYFQHFMVDSFYDTEDKADLDIIKFKLIKIWEYILGYTTNKTHSDVDTFLEIYKIFDKTLHN